MTCALDARDQTPDEVRLRGAILEPGFFNVGRGVTLDLTECTLSLRAVGGLVRLVREERRVQIRMPYTCQPQQAIETVFGPHHLHYLGGTDWELS
ncbi:MAG: hypothetical protein ACK47B_10885 [Armatimonadota bacterium]